MGGYCFDMVYVAGVVTMMLGDGSGGGSIQGGMIAVVMTLMAVMAVVVMVFKAGNSRSRRDTCSLVKAVRYLSGQNLSDKPGCISSYTQPSRNFHLCTALL
ncbi:hypothetical protein E2C01_010012 [Portunus trituberculatus]|uniref:Uncharacterized protein n=1 Tax=Portunus trituberculatus TaxID=210409 RepID=A0A5B7D7K3_PORTR|nr:hypothetical protein [Portunus trituberculatus]